MTQQTIPQIDKAINDLRRNAPRPADFFDRETALYRERGFAQLARDEAADRARIREAQRPLCKIKCPACGGFAYGETAPVKEG